MRYSARNHAPLLLTGLFMSLSIEGAAQAEPTAQLAIHWSAPGRATLWLRASDLEAPDLLEAISENWPCDLEDWTLSEGGWLEVSCPDLTVRGPFTETAVLDFRGVVDKLEAAGIGGEGLLVTLGHRELPLSRLEGVEWSEGEGLWNGGPFVTLVLHFGGRVPGALLLEWGFGRERIFRAAAMLASGFTLPLLLTLGFRRKMLSRPAGSKDPEAWFSYWRYLHLLSFGSLCLWFVLLVGISADDILDAYLASAGIEGPGAFLALLILPPFAATALSQMLSAAVLDHLHGSSGVGRRVARAFILGNAYFFMPLFLALLGIEALFRDPRAGALFFGGALATRLALARLLIRDDDFTPHAVTVGDLRDRLFALSKRLGVRVKQLYVVPAVETRMANAFAVHGGNVVLTDFLLQRLDKREVDGIVAHELSHLRHRHPLLLFGGLVVAGAVVVFVGSSVQTLGFSLVPLWIQVSAGLTTTLLLYFLMWRRFELTADTDAVLLTQDPESMVTALAKLTRANVLPRAWGGWSRWFLTHPSLEERARKIAERWNLSDERLTELLAADVEGDRYSRPGEVAATRVFSTKFKSGNLVRILFWVLAAAILPPLGVALVATRLAGPALWGVYGLGVPLCALVLFGVADRAVMFGHPQVRRLLAAKLASEGVDTSRGWFVAYAPHREARLYEGYSCWDFGFLFLESGRLVYLGDHARFEIPRDAIANIAIVKGHPSWTPVARVCLLVVDHGGRERPLSWAVGDCRSATASREETARLARRLEEWRAGASGETATVVPDSLPPPPNEEVTSELPGASVTPGRVLSTMSVFAICAFLACALARLDLAEGGWYVMGMAAGAAFLESAPSLYARTRNLPP
jgi:heat shock protein HtpX